MAKAPMACILYQSPTAESDTNNLLEKSSHCCEQKKPKTDDQQEVGSACKRQDGKRQATGCCYASEPQDVKRVVVVVG